jgi:hypothetical protein
MSWSQLSVIGTSSPRIIAVQDNQTTMQVPPEALGMVATCVPSYLEALGLLVAQRAGISAAALKPSLRSLSRLND